MNNKPLKEILVDYIKNIDLSNILSEPRVEWLAEYLLSLVNHNTIKFIDGQLRHGGELEDGSVDLKQELRNELVDASLYFRALTHPMKKP